ncbi:hypothetical protein [Rhodococcus rhodnii]|uniref:Uncharacterized protein n=1 Tax=Rhodococcus rhodnii LMG 5362 TaxID=1273125 RepID=R7WRQ2_9NOCA|nr:hypothetical protein [Rhodococcus rhodnii]EOM77960.1 hypothetical protein Rrhod_0634 [Rhodococcus rhodnii LMG 5362]
MISRARIDVRGAVSAAAAVASGVLAGFVLSNPRADRWAIHASDRELERWLSSQPTGLVVGTLLAVIVVGALQRAGSARRPWIAALACIAVLAATRSALPDVGSIDSLVALHFAKTAAAGVLLGCAVAGVWSRASKTARTRVALALAVFATFLLASTIRPPVSPVAYLEPVSRSTSALGEPAWWLLAVAAVATTAAAFATRAADRTQYPTRLTLRACLLGALALAVTHRVLGAWIESREFASTSSLWTAVIVSLVLVCAVTAATARFVGSADGRILLAGTGVVAAAAGVLHDLRTPLVSVPTWAMLTVGVAGCVLGAVAALRGLAAHWGLAIAALAPAVAAIAPDFGSDGVALLARLFVVGLGGTAALVAALPGGGAVAAFGLSLPFAAFTLVTAASVPRSPTSLFDVPSLPEGFEYGFDVDTVPAATTVSDHLVGVALLAVTAYFAFAILRSGVVESDGDTTGSVDDAEGVEPPEDEK